MEQSEKTLDMIVNLCKNRGYVFPGSEIYGGLANSWDYGPLGVEFKNNVKKAWLKKFVQESPYNVGLDAAIIMNPQTWVTTGHVSSFSDPLLDCRACKARHRADKLIGEEHPEVNVDAMSFDEMDAFIAEHEDIVCPVCGKHDFTVQRRALVQSTLFTPLSAADAHLCRSAHRHRLAIPDYAYRHTALGSLIYSAGCAVDAVLVAEEGALAVGQCRVGDCRVGHGHGDRVVWQHC